MSSEISRRRATQRPLHLSSPSHRRRNRPITPRNLPNLSEPIDDILHKASSEPLILNAAVGAVDNRRSLVSDGRLFRSMTCSDDVFSNSPPLLSPRSNQAYPDDSRVLVTVTVEGSPGPIRTLVKLSSSVEEAIKLVTDEYAKEARSPPLDTDAASLYELHLSSFSLESLDRSDTIGSIGSRTFYLRKRRSVVQALTSEISCAAAEVMSPPCQPCPLMVLLPAYISRGIAKILRRMCNLWKVFGCLQHDS